ncbi:MAG: WYL domain-containing protein [Chitinophagaceae bacterium]|nr:WYL domain-containing protein [Chitinophagaceae bacterium]
MPVNRNALIRYRTIDKCLQNRRRKWTIEDLIDACSEALYEYERTDKPISMRTIRLDLNAMRSEQLGYNAPIIVVDKKYYTYEDADYSITNIPLTTQDLGILQEVSHLLRQFKGFNHFNEVSEMINKLEDKIYSEQHHQSPVIDFEKNELLTGLQWLDQLYKCIIEKSITAITYQSFKARQPGELVFYPYLLKEYRNRWFVLGMHKKDKQLLTLALDRIQQIERLPGERYKEQHDFNGTDYFKDIIGVSRNNQEPVTVLFWADHHQAPYIKTKPLHESQQIVETAKEGILFSIKVIPNLELERELLGFGEGLRVIAPNNLVRKLKKRTEKMFETYNGSDK